MTIMSIATEENLLWNRREVTSLAVDGVIQEFCPIFAHSEPIDKGQIQ